MRPTFPTLITAPVSQRFNNLNPQFYGGDHRHKGIDFGIPVGSNVYSCLPGIVDKVLTSNTGYGRHIVIRHQDGSCAIYAHLSKTLVSVGDVVINGQLIGKSGGDPKDAINGDGNSTGAHLHWEIRPAGAKSDQEAVDPTEYCLRSLPKVTTSARCTAGAGLNVRTAPTTSAPVVYLLPTGSTVWIAERQGEWARIHALRPEFNQRVRRQMRRNWNFCGACIPSFTSGSMK